jgi:hypothetical protein
MATQRDAVRFNMAIQFIPLVTSGILGKDGLLDEAAEDKIVESAFRLAEKIIKKGEDSETKVAVPPRKLVTS